ncbi:MAG: hypothetical protein H6557_33660 [Lewinellaceae bacterium]|nr:hypothetical protein [Lewinellaceae bacterium]
MFIAIRREEGLETGLEKGQELNERIFVTRVWKKAWRRKNSPSPRGGPGWGMPIWRICRWNG